MYKIIGADGKEYGPISREQLKQWLAEGRLNLQSQVLPEGSTDWKTLGEIPELVNAPVPPNLPQYPTFTPTGDVPNYLWQSIVITLCCCLPFGIVAIVYAAQVKSKVSVGDIAGAQASSSKAKMWCWIGFGVGLLVNVIVFAIQFLAVAAAGKSGL
jgi:hypothetical protein